MTTRTPEGAVAWAIRILDANPHHRGARAFLGYAAEGPALYAGDAQAALDRAAHNRETQPPPDHPDPHDWPPGWGSRSDLALSETQAFTPRFPGGGARNPGLRPGLRVEGEHPGGRADAGRDR